MKYYVILFNVMSEVESSLNNLCLTRIKLKEECVKTCQKSSRRQYSTWEQVHRESFYSQIFLRMNYKRCSTALLDKTYGPKATWV